VQSRRALELALREALRNGELGPIQEVRRHKRHR
jgi:hypothetical protein